MTWKVYALVSGGAFLATYVLSAPPGSTTPPAEPAAAAPRPASSVDIDMSELADRLTAHVAGQAAYDRPVRNAFRFREAAPIPSDAPASAPEVSLPVPAPPARPPFALAGVASNTSQEATTYTAILSSLQGVVLARAGEALPGGYLVVSVGEDSAVVDASDGTRTTLRLSGTAAR